MAISPDALAARVRDAHPTCRVPPVNVVRLAWDLGLATEPVDGLRSSGQLVVKNGQPTILFEAAQPEGRRQFTIAHEIAHYLLAEVDGIPLDEQKSDRAVERVCDQFANRLLLPREWVQEVFGASAVELRTVESLRRRGFVSRTHALSALNHYLGHWSAALMYWKWDDWDGWRLVSRTMPTTARRRIEVDRSTSDWLETAGRPASPSYVPFSVSGRTALLEAEVQMRATDAWLFVDLRQVAGKATSHS